ncbi:MAG: peptide chain release factor N(5)-glutamine methyltransferase [Rhodoferax sp.]|uniref:peptide chain release factor N(5)-glutamine methyltransferase n=1 Tax=Rhodoferax sp. TaxID=50421 RepID=UPI001B4E8F6D|nr:peptide chain release factor N(5)-glutamine methyltransferase [Rhodoferax sp.]MBP9736119.1 peptide chain release factor N(5)-glutamine methyltransferase [Rhodoferax sp.]
MSPGRSISRALAQLRTLGLDRLDAQLLLLHVLERPLHQRSWLLSHDDEVLTPSQCSVLETLAHRRVGGEPLAYLTGSKEFFGLSLHVDKRVLVPRPDTETLVNWALAVFHGPRSVLDLGTGSGAIALALKASCPELRVEGIDASPQAVAVARANALNLQLEVNFNCGVWFQGLADPASRFDGVVSNPPYIATKDPHLAALRHEPLQALVSGPDGLDDLRHIIGHSPAHLRPGGWLLLEHGFDQAPAVRRLLAAAGFIQIQSHCDLAGIERCSGGQVPAAAGAQCQI